MSQKPALTTEEQRLNNLWNEHIRAEFAAHNADEAIVTMVANPEGGWINSQILRANGGFA